MTTSLQIGYCTNVHAGPSLAETKANLERYALRVKQQVSPHAPMGVGLWIASPAAAELASPGELEHFAAWLNAAGLVPFTFNGFPFGDFHGPVVKHRVYEPTWWDDARCEYTCRLFDIQQYLLPDGSEGSISTLPIAWPDPVPQRDQLAKAAANLYVVAEKLARMKEETGRTLSLCLEPEPGCYLQRSDEVLAFFRDWLLPGRDEAIIREHLRVCHDVCHAAVMFERQDDVLNKYAAAGIEVGKVQVSSAVVARFAELSPADRAAAFAQLSGFHEPRYLHQTCIAREKEISFYEDLPLALATAQGAEGPSGEWRMHFHVPVYLEKFNFLWATQQDIRDCLATIRQTSRCRHFEVETYAWGVLPADLQVPDLAEGIAREMAWFMAQVSG